MPLVKREEVMQSTYSLPQETWWSTLHKWMSIFSNCWYCYFFWQHREQIHPPHQDYITHKWKTNLLLKIHSAYFLNAAWPQHPLHTSSTHHNETCDSRTTIVQLSPYTTGLIATAWKIHSQVVYMYIVDAHVHCTSAITHYKNRLVLNRKVLWEKWKVADLVQEVYIYSKTKTLI